MDNKLGTNMEERNSRLLSVDSPNRHRSLSNAPSERSGITLVSDDTSTINRFEAEVSKQEQKRPVGRFQTWINHLRGLLCMKPSEEAGEVGMPANRLIIKEGEDDDESPWIRNVFVQSTIKYDEEHFAPQRARCTFDTGNLQGNLVSKDFLINTLKWPESSFLELTDRERLPGVGVTGHHLNCEGAVELTWYHRKSTKVFYNMRFLISPHDHYDLIIGSRSILKHNLVSIPNLMVDPSSFGAIIVTGIDKFELAVLDQIKSKAVTRQEELEKENNSKKKTKDTEGKLERAKLISRAANLSWDVYDLQNKKGRSKQISDAIDKVTGDLKAEGDKLTADEADFIMGKSDYPVYKKK